MIKMSVRGVEKLQAFFKKLPPAARKIAAPEIAIHLIGDDNRGLKHYVGYKYVSRKSAYGQTFSSDKQRRYVMAKIRSGEITPGRSNRSDKLSRTSFSCFSSFLFSKEKIITAEKHQYSRISIAL